MPGKKIKVLMVAFELPPFNSGGLGEACLGLTKALSKYVDITFLLPVKLDYKYNHMKVIFADEFLTDEEKKLSSYNFCGYECESYKNLETLGINVTSDRMVKRALLEKFDIVHTHDWMTAKAGLEISKKTKTPFIFQLHSTEIDRSPIEYIDKQKFGLEKLGVENANQVIAVSDYTKGIIQSYFEKARKISTVHNAVEVNKTDKTIKLKINRPIILSLGRITYQKGLEYMLISARRVVDQIPEALFVIVGDGDKYIETVEKAAELGLSGNIIFTGFLRGEERETVYNSASAFIMPSRSEPFGLVAIEAASKGVPTVVSKQSGVCEVLKGTEVVDFWDTELMASKIVKILTSKKHKDKIVRQQNKSINVISWENSAKKVFEIYKGVLK